MPDEFTVPPSPVGPPPVEAQGDGAPPETADLAPNSSGAATAPVAGPNRRTATLARIGLLGIAAAALVAVAMLAFGSSLAPTRTLAGSDSGSGGSSGATADGFAFMGGPGAGRGHGVMFGGITITAISGNDVSLETEDGWTRTITVDDGTTYTKSGDDIALGDLAVGDTIAFRQTLEDDGSWTIDAIVVILPHVGGEVTAVAGSTITVEGRDGESDTITVNGDTAYQVNNDAATLADVKVGMVLIAEGPDNGDGSITATKVKAFDRDGFFGRPGAGSGGPGLRLGPGFDWNGDGPDATAAPDASAS